MWTKLEGGPCPNPNAFLFLPFTTRQQVVWPGCPLKAFLSRWLRSKLPTQPRRCSAPLLNLTPSSKPGPVASRPSLCTPPHFLSPQKGNHLTVREPPKAKSERVKPHFPALQS